jgi:hypothetical protein
MKDGSHSTVQLYSKITAVILSVVDISLTLVELSTIGATLYRFTTINIHITVTDLYYLLLLF